MAIVRVARFLVLCGRFVASSDVELATFDGAPETSKAWSELNDPAMGGKSNGTAVVNTTGQVLIVEGEVVDVPSLQAPGFIAVQSAVADWPDASSAYGGDLILRVRSSTPDYRGFRVTFNAGSLSPKYSCAGGGSLPFSRGCYKARFMVPEGEGFSEVRVPFTSFSDVWDPKTGEQTKTCEEESGACPSAKGLAKIQMLEFMAEGVAGKVHLEVKSISAGRAESQSRAASPAAGDDATCKWCKRICGVLAIPARHGGNATMQTALQALNKACGGSPFQRAETKESESAPMAPMPPNMVCQILAMSMGKVLGWLATGATAEQVCGDPKYLQMCQKQPLQQTFMV